MRDLLTEWSPIGCYSFEVHHDLSSNEFLNLHLQLAGVRTDGFRHLLAVLEDLERGHGTDLALGRNVLVVWK